MIAACQYFPYSIAIVIATSLAIAAAEKGFDKLDKFCSRVFSTKDTDADESIVDCSCCATSHLSGDYGSQVALRYGGHLDAAVAFDKGQAIGEVPAWSMGNFVPRVTCEKDNVLMCICEGKGNVKLDEPACRTGPQCKLIGRPGEFPEKLSPAKTPDETAQDQAAVEDEVNKETEHTGDEAKRATAPNADPEEKNKASEENEDSEEMRESCTFIARPAGAKYKRRVPLGSARCEDADPKQCSMFYAKRGDAYHHCASFIAPKTCKARLTKKARAQKKSQGIDAWGAKHAFIPGAWPVAIDADGTVRPEKPPSIRDFEKFADNLPPRIVEGANFE